MRIRHLDSPSGYYAAYSVPYSPFAMIEPLLYFGLVQRSRDHGEDREDEVVGFVVSGDSVSAADDLEGFAQYWRPRTSDVEAEYQSLFTQLYQNGYNAFIDANPHLAPAPSPPVTGQPRHPLRLRGE